MSTNGPAEHRATLTRMLAAARYDRRVYFGLPGQTEADAKVDALSWALEMVEGAAPPSAPREAVRVLAERLAADLFVNNYGEEAERLVLIEAGPSARDLGGWSRRAVANRIETALRTEGE